MNVCRRSCSLAVSTMCGRVCVKGGGRGCVNEANA